MKMKSAYALVFLATILTAACQNQVVIKNVEQAVFFEWFYSSLGWVAIAAVIVGIILSFFLCRLDPQSPLPHTNRRARAIFGVVVSLMTLVIVPGFLLTHSFLTQPFGNIRKEVEFWNCFSLVVLHWMTLVTMIVFALISYVTTGIMTRTVFGKLVGKCDCGRAFFG